MSFIQSHARVASALVIREMATRFGGKPGGYAWALLDPLFHVLLLTIIFGAIARTPPLGSSFTLFFATGYIAFQFYQAMSTYVAAAIKANKPLLSYPQVAPVDTVVARYILQLVTTSVVAVCILGWIILSMDEPLRIDWLIVLEAAFVSTLLGVGMGLMNISLFVRSPLYEQVFNVINRPMFMVSGVFFEASSMPRPYADYLAFNPITHIVMWFRTGFYPGYNPDLLDKGYVVEFAFVLIFIGLILLSISAAALRND